MPEEVKTEEKKDDKKKKGPLGKLRDKIIPKNAEFSKLINGFKEAMKDNVFDSEEVSYFGEKKIITIDNIKYEKVQYTITSEAQQLPVYSSNDFLTWWFIDITANVDGHGLVILPIFDAMVPLSLIEEDDVITLHWTILREVN